MNKAFLDYYRCPDNFAAFELANNGFIQPRPGYFKFGSDLICYGKSILGGGQKVTDSLPDVSEGVQRNGFKWIIPFDPTEVADNLRYERYVAKAEKAMWKKLTRSIYYALRPVLTVTLRRHLQRLWLKRACDKEFPTWPVDRTVDKMFEKLMALAVQSSSDNKVPFIWFWPEGKSACAIMTHDVETSTGLKLTGKLMDIAEAHDLRSSFQLIPDARYVVDLETLSKMKNRGFEVNIHDLKHDGHLFDMHQQFQKAALRINDFAVKFGSKGFRSGALYRNQEWFDEFRLSYDMSVPNVGHLDPQPGGCCTVMPFFVGELLEIPVTTTQDYSLFNIIRTYSVKLWVEQIEKILQQHGLISFIIHPDYLDCPKALSVYKKLLGKLVELRSEAALWICLPGEVDIWWRQRSRMTLVLHKNRWKIEGIGAERARVAYATAQDGNVRYTFQ